MVAQTFLPERWVIVDDGRLIGRQTLSKAMSNAFRGFQLARQPARSDRNFAGKVDAFNVGLRHVQALQYDVIGNLDADVSFEPDHLEFLMHRFSEDPKLGVAGTPFTQQGYDSARDSFEGENHVAGQCQLFRRECFEEIGGYVANRAGGIDWMAVTAARMKGWKTRSFQNKRYHYYWAMGTAQRGALAALFSYGEKIITSAAHPSGNSSESAIG